MQLNSVTDKGRGLVKLLAKSNQRKRSNQNRGTGWGHLSLYAVLFRTGDLILCAGPFWTSKGLPDLALLSHPEAASSQTTMKESRATNPRPFPASPFTEADNLFISLTLSINGLFYLTISRTNWLYVRCRR